MVGKDSPRGYRLLEKNTSARAELSPTVLSAREAPEAPQTIRAAATAVGCMPELDDMTLLLVFLHVRALTVGQEENNLGLNWKLPP